MKGCEYCKNCKNENCSLGYTADNGFNNTDDISNNKYTLKGLFNKNGEWISYQTLESNRYDLYIYDVLGNQTAFTVQNISSINEMSKINR